jgi:cytochrome P450
MNHAATVRPARPRPAPASARAVYDFDMFYAAAFLPDPPEHSRYRAPLQHAFSPKAALALTEYRAVVREHLSERPPNDLTSLWLLRET